MDFELKVKLTADTHIGHTTFSLLGVQKGLTQLFWPGLGGEAAEMPKWYW